MNSRRRIFTPRLTRDISVTQQPEWDAVAYIAPGHELPRPLAGCAAETPPKAATPARDRRGRGGPESDLSRCSKTLIVGFLPGFRSTKSGLLAACSAGYAALSAAATLAPTTRALNSSTVITSAVENASIVNVARWTSAADSAP